MGKPYTIITNQVLALLRSGTRVHVKSLGAGCKLPLQHRLGLRGLPYLPACQQGDCSMPHRLLWVSRCTGCRGVLTVGSKHAAHACRSSTSW